MAWTEADRAAALAWQIEQELLCSGCGHPTDETMKPEAEGGYEVHRVKCHACAARDTRAHDTQGSNNGIYYRTAKAR